MIKSIPQYRNVIFLSYLIKGEKKILEKFGLSVREIDCLVASLKGF